MNGLRSGVVQEYPTNCWSTTIPIAVVHPNLHPHRKSLVHKVWLIIIIVTAPKWYSMSLRGMKCYNRQISDKCNDTRTSILPSADLQCLNVCIGI